MVLIDVLNFSNLLESSILIYSEPNPDSWTQGNIHCPQFINPTINLTGIDVDAFEFKPLASTMSFNNQLVLERIEKKCLRIYRN